ncbi:hypothetical protein DFJ58DRAFT_230028 [Suillus subalutaceus]|uniref:uncharacterized protein n=1 Tax=Suillus subalutaceus TaxID=48586 RepID=UPI001B883076|nr:uncharacterized protein DFJ58DRAFT_230028 [Suillus subalutaceus]KAG1832877.1 hypothetical protein DFJ58DRAFT_230028 [Suillus subalutaceus]
MRIMWTSCEQWDMPKVVTWTTSPRLRGGKPDKSYCQGIREAFGQRGSSSTQDQHAHKLSRDQGSVRSARLELDTGSTHSQPVKGSGTRSVSEARARHRINTLTSCQGIRDAFGQRGSSSTQDQHTHILPRDQGRVRSARLELDTGSTNSPTVKGSGTRSVSEARARHRINTLTFCQGIRDAFGQRGSSSTQDQHTHVLSTGQQCPSLRSACWQKCDQTHYLQVTVKYE